MSDVVVGIDLGTTFSAVAFVNQHGMPQVIPNADGRRTTPSVVYFEESGVAVVGQAARNQALAEPGRTVQFIKREMGNPDYRFDVDGVEYVPEGLSALILRKLKDDAEAFLGTDVTRVVISVPAYFKDSQRSATKTAGELAGLEVVAMINEPTAAAIAYGLGKDGHRQHVLVYDFGGGTFDVTILRIEGNEFTVIATDGDARLGGVDIDGRVADHLAQQFLDHHGIDLRTDPFTRLDLWERAEAAKIGLSTRTSVMVTLAAGTTAMRVDLDREQLTNLVADLLARTGACVERALGAATLDWPVIDAVLMVGGTSRMPAVRDLVREASGKEPSVDVNPDECVALGAALRATLSDVHESEAEAADRPPPDPDAPPPPPVLDIVVRDVAPHSLGVRAVDADGNPVNSIIIPRLTEVPCERKRTYATRVDGQRSIEVHVLQGEDPDPYSPTVEAIGRLRIDDLPERPAGEVIVAVTLSYDADGVVEVTAEELLGGTVVREQLLRKSGELDDETRARMKRAVEDSTPPEAAPGDDEPPEPEPPGEDGDE